ncbi:MAG: response regulator transcription factor [Oscillospiraceae bacterium]|nr:response regulator transcription factor [Oscillospiraceae bacterium]
MYRILVCDDDREVVSSIRIYLNAEGYQTVCAYSGQECLDKLREQEIHLVILDVVMPEKDGISTLSELREWSNVPVILLSAKAEDTDKIAGLNVGADDYMTKPYNPVELVARIKAQLRRYLQLGAGPRSNSQIKIGSLVLDDATKTVLVDHKLVSLTPLEYEILSLLMKNAGKVYTPKEIYRSVWNEAPMGAENAVAVHVRHIREKIEPDPAEPRYLKVVWGKGYKINDTGY